VAIFRDSFGKKRQEDEGAEALLKRFGAQPQETPVAIWLGEKVLKNPSNAELARAIGLDVDTSREQVYDLIVVGAGPAGLAAAGDVRSGSVKRVASAVGEGSMAVRFVHQYLAEASTPQRTRVT
jgi:thioredoxin reductase (NADPH)